MARVECEIAAPPSRVFEVLADGWVYSGWVVGTSHMRAVEAGWPAVGSRLHHASGAWPAVVRDHTIVEAMEPDRRLVMTARGKAMGAARIDIVLNETAGGTKVTMDETPVDGPGRWLNNPVAERLLYRRNIESLARLRVLAERPAQPLD